MRSLSVMTSAIVLSLVAACTATQPNPVNDVHPSASDAKADGPVVPRLVAHFDPSAGELPEGLLVTKDTAYVGFAPTSRVVRVDLATGAATPFGQLPTPVAGKGFMTGLAQSPSGDVYAGLVSFVPEVQAGIYRIPQNGGAATLFAKDAALPFPNALAFDSDGSLFASDSGTGSVFRIDGKGNAERWATADLLTGQKEACGGAGPGFAIGANGIVVERDAVYVVNMDQATLVKIPRVAAGKAGAPLIIAGPDCETLGGADGLARAPDGSFVIAVNRQNKIVRVNSGGMVETIATGVPFDFPASVAYRGDTLYATNFALKNASAGKPAAPGVVRVAN